MRWAEYNDTKIVRIFTDSASGKNFDREGIQRAKDEAIRNNEQYDGFLVLRWDRLGRNALQSLQFIEDLAGQKIEVNAVSEWIETSRADTFSMLCFFLGSAEVERRKISSRTIAAIDTLKSKGYHVNSPPYGYKKAAKLDVSGRKIMQIDESKSVIVRYAFKEFSTGEVSQAQIIKNVNSMYGKGSLSKSVLSRLLRSPIYDGRLPIYSRERKGFERKKITEIIEGKHTPIISRAIFDKCQIILEKKTSKKYGQNTEKTNLYFLKGHVKCSKCNRLLSATKTINRHNKTYYYYYCLNRCEKSSFQVFDLHDAFFQLLTELSFDFDIAERVNKAILKLIRQSNEGKNKIVSKLSEELIKLKGNKKHIEDNLTSYIPETFSKYYQSISERIDAAESKKLIHSNELLEEIAFDTYDLHRLFSNLNEAFRNNDVRVKRELIEFLFPRGFIYNQERKLIVAEKYMWLIGLSQLVKNQ